MKRLILHIALCFGICLTYGQILAPMGAGLPAAPEKIETYKNGAAVAYVDQNNKAHVSEWNGYFWADLTTPLFPLIKNGIEIIDLCANGEKLYIAIGNNTTSGSKSIWERNGTLWTDITDSEFSSSIEIIELVVQDDKLKCIGKFKNGSEASNVLTYNGTSWEKEGNLITKNIELDRIDDAIVSKSKILATGAFTSPTSSNVTLAEWNGTSWTPANYPPFLGENIALGYFNDNVVVYGKSNFDNESFKIQVNGTWQNMSAGLEGYTVKKVSNMSQAGTALLAVGDFKRKSDGKNTNLMVFEGGQWDETSLTLSEIQQIHSNGSEIYISGDFSDNGRLNGIGTIYTDRAQITTRVFEDSDNDCEKDANEKWLTNYPLVDNSNEVFIPTDEFGTLYLQVDKEEHTLNAGSHRNYEPTCPDVTVNVTEYKNYFGAAFGVKKKTGVNDALVTLSDVQSVSAKENDTKTAILCSENIGSTTLSNTEISLILGSGISNFSSTRPTTSFDGVTAKWSVDLTPSSQVCFELSYDVISLEQAHLFANIKPMQTDVNKENNSTELRYKSGETAPNGKHCLNGKIIDPSENQVVYKVSFQNLNSEPIVEVKIVDEVQQSIGDRNIGMSGITSHAGHASTRVHSVKRPDNFYDYTLVTTFTDIILSPMNENENESKGFIDYTFTLASGSLSDVDVICNQAKIYFKTASGNYLEPITTKNVCSSVGTSLSTPSHSNLPQKIEGLNIGPNPVSNLLYIENNLKDSHNLQLVNALGQTLKSYNILAYSEQVIDIRSLYSGIYFIYANGLFVQKVVVH